MVPRKQRMLGNIKRNHILIFISFLFPYSQIYHPHRQHFTNSINQFKMNKKVQFSCDVEFVSTFANEDYGKFLQRILELEQGL